MAFLHNGCGLAFAHPQSDLLLIKATEPRRISSGPSALHLKSKSLPFLDAPGSLDGSFAGDIGFDPLGLSEIPFDFSQLVVPRQFSGRPSSATLATLYWMREAEVKHGRVAMLAVLGCVAVDLGARLPGAAFAGVRDALGAHDVMVGGGACGPRPTLWPPPPRSLPSPPLPLHDGCARARRAAPAPPARQSTARASPFFFPARGWLSEETARFIRVVFPMFSSLYDYEGGHDGVLYNLHVHIIVITAGGRGGVLSLIERRAPAIKKANVGVPSWSSFL